MELQKMKEQLVIWMDSMKHGYRDSKMYMCKVDHRDGFRIRLFTDSNYYTISAFPPDGDYDGYLGCQGNSRTPRAGEDWTRGNDLADGPFSEKTWIEIMYDIVGYELVKIQRPIKLLYKNGE